MHRILPCPRINPSRWGIVGSGHPAEQDVDGAAAITALDTGDRVPVTWKGSKARVRSGPGARDMERVKGAGAVRTRRRG